jgi:mono/diheme cytochrome c family protein
MKNIIFVGMGLALLASTAQAADNAANLQEGKKVYDYWCLPCHGPGPGNPGQEFLPGTQQLAIKYKGTKISPLLEERTDMVPEFVKLMVRQGVSIMPQFRKVEISDAQLDALAAYLSGANPALRRGAGQ